MREETDSQIDRQVGGRGVGLSAPLNPPSTHPPAARPGGRGAEDGRAAKRGKGEAQPLDEKVEEEEEWEERDDRGNLWARGREMKRQRRRGGRCARCSPHSRMVSCCLLRAQHTVQPPCHEGCSKKGKISCTLSRFLSDTSLTQTYMITHTHASQQQLNSSKKQHF